MLNYGEKNRETLINLVTRNFSRFYTRPEVKESFRQCWERCTFKEEEEKKKKYK